MKFKKRFLSLIFILVFVTSFSYASESYYKWYTLKYGDKNWELKLSYKIDKDKIDSYKNYCIIIENNDKISEVWNIDKGEKYKRFEYKYNKDKIEKWIWYNKDNLVSLYYTYEWKNDLLYEKKCYNSKDKYKWYEKYNYNNDKTINSVEKYNNKDVRVQKKLFFYNNSFVNKIEYYNSDDKLDFKEDYKYNKQGSLLHRIRYSANGAIKEEEKYTIENDLIVEKYELLPHNVVNITKYKYDSKNNLIEESYFDENNKLDAFVTEIAYRKYKYNDNGQLIEESYYNTNGQLEEDFKERAKIEHIYSKDGIPEKQLWYNAEGKLIFTIEI